MIIISTKICTYQLSIVSTITTKKENISWFIENKIEWLVCDVFAISLFFRILSLSEGYFYSFLHSISQLSYGIPFCFIILRRRPRGVHSTHWFHCSMFNEQFKARHRKWILGLFVYCLHIIKAIFHSEIEKKLLE